MRQTKRISATIGMLNKGYPVETVIKEITKIASEPNETFEAGSIGEQYLDGEGDSHE